MTRSRRPQSAADAYAALKRAMVDADPACLGDPRFTAEDAPLEPLTGICAGCPLFRECEAVALSSQTGPIWGVVAGRIRRGSSPTTLSRVD